MGKGGRWGEAIHAGRGPSGESVDGVEAAATGERTRQGRERELDKPAGDKGHGARDVVRCSRGSTQRQLIPPYAVVSRPTVGHTLHSRCHKDTAVGIEK